MAEQDFDIKIRTTADTAGAKQTAAELKNISDQAYDIGRRLRLLGGAAIISGGYQFVQQLKEASTQIIKISAELDKQGEQLVKNAIKHAEMAKFATTQADAIKIGESALKGVESSRQRMLDASAKELSIWQKIADIWAGGQAPFSFRGPQAAALDLEREQATQNYMMERQNAIYDIQAAKTNQARRATQSYEETVKELTDRIKEQEALANTHWQQQDIESYLAAAAAVEKYKKELESLAAAHEKAVSKTAKDIEGASPQAKAILMNEAAMFRARETGQGRADLFEKSALELRRGATPGQLEEVKKIYSNKEVVDAIDRLANLWK